MTKQKYKITTHKPARRKSGKVRRKPASPAPGIFSFIVLAAAISLPLYGVVYDNRLVWMERQEADQLASDLMAAMPALPEVPSKVITGKKMANGMRDLGQITSNPKVIHPKTDAERSRLVAEVWNLKPGDKLALNLR